MARERGIAIGTASLTLITVAVPCFLQEWAAFKSPVLWLRAVLLLSSLQRRFTELLVTNSFSCTYQRACRMDRPT